MATKITYATLGGDSLEDLHRELDAAIAAAPQTFGREHLLYINGKHLKADAQFDDRSPIDTGIALGTFQKGTREHVKSAVAAARAAYPAWAALSWQERLCVRAPDCRCDSHPPLRALGADGLRGRQEPARMRGRCRRRRRSHGLLLRSDRAAQRIRRKDGNARARRGQRQRAAAVRRVGGHLAVQFSARARGGTGRRRACRGKHRRVQACERHAVDRRDVHRDGRRSRPAAGRVQLRHRPGIDRGTGAHRQRRHRRHRLYRIERSRAEADARQRGARGAAAADYRDGRKEPRHRHGQRGPRQGDRRRHALGVRRAGAEVLGLLARLHAEGRARQVRAAPGRENQAHQDRQPARARRVDGACHQRRRPSGPTCRRSSARRRTAGRFL